MRKAFPSHCARIFGLPAKLLGRNEGTPSRNCNRIRDKNKTKTIKIEKGMEKIKGMDERRFNDAMNKGGSMSSEISSYLLFTAHHTSS